MSGSRPKRNSRGSRTKKKSSGLRATRRRLSVVSDNKLIEGISSIGQDATGTKVEEESKSNHVIRCFWGSSKKGYAPYNPRKRNQDSILMKEHKSTGTLMLCVLDGHGEAGDLVSHFITDHLARKTFAHKDFKSAPGKAMRDEVLKLEQALLKGAWDAVPRSTSPRPCMPWRVRAGVVGVVGAARVLCACMRGSSLPPARSLLVPPLRSARRVY